MSEPIINKPHNDEQCSQSIKQTIEDWVQSIKQLPSSLWYDFKMFIKNIKRFIDWAPVIWKDRDWSDHYLLIIIRKKLIAIHNDSKNWNWVDCEKQTAIIKQCIDDIDILLEYSDGEILNCVKQEYQQFIDKYGQLQSWSTAIKDNDFYEVHLAYSKCTTQELADQADNEIVKLYKLQDQRIVQINDRLWNTIRDNHYNWWN